jgi:hypothetical protein
MPNLVLSYPIRDDFVEISRSVANGSSNTLTISSIPTTYNHLQLVFSGRSTAVDGFGRSEMIMRCNGDTGSNYGNEFIRAAGSSYSAAGHQTTFMYAGEFPNAVNPANYPAQFVIDIVNYKNTTFYKTLAWSDKWGTPSGFVGYVGNHAGTYRSTSAINSVSLIVNTSGNFVSGSTLICYGY